jgi:hypothetical protein
MTKDQEDREESIKTEEASVAASPQVKYDSSSIAFVTAAYEHQLYGCRSK